MYQRILLTDDGSPLARSAIPHAVHFATTAQTGVLVLRVSHAAGEDRRQLVSDSWPARVSSDGAGERAEGRFEADPPLTDVTEALTNAGIAAVGALVVKDDDPGAAIVDVATTRTRLERMHRWRSALRAPSAESLQRPTRPRNDSNPMPQTVARSP
jgi:hypothetical protein